MSECILVAGFHKQLAEFHPVTGHKAGQSKSLEDKRLVEHVKLHQYFPLQV